ncbi:GPI anchored serine-threonine rich protein [Penicillium argentinense]|uniref:GPI anchored serine-threonine rich protein n=1 Tax=Penicillium argentinense TaxID=1131581 RepID=A0A9W9EQA3_9EURO|nr:GPI anchored serine-threonine rich protein [Penicillium argentinense]KAJ5085871.1 GPI anchored serine-threonine rich protein [Penicillium argentinense]
MRFSSGAIFSTLVAFAAAYTQPDYSKPPSGNAVRAPGLNEQVPEGTPYEIKWDADKGDRVSLVLLRGPSTNVVPLETIVENIPNSGHYTWTPGYNLTPDTTHYGLLIVVEGTGAYQWSSQFGISKGSGSGSSGSGSHSTVTIVDDVTTTICPETETETPAPTSTPATIVTVIDNVTTTICPEEDQTSTPAAVPTSTATPVVTPSSVAPVQSSSTVYGTIEVTTTICPEEASSTATPVAPVVSSHVPHVPSSISTLKSTPLSSAGATGTASATPSSTPVFNGAGRTSISLGAVMAGVFAVMAF